MIKINKHEQTDIRIIFTDIDDPLDITIYPFEDGKKIKYLIPSAILESIYEYIMDNICDYIDSIREELDRESLLKVNEKVYDRAIRGMKSSIWSEFRDAFDEIVRSDNMKIKEETKDYILVKETTTKKNKIIIINTE